MMSKTISQIDLKSYNLLLESVRDHAITKMKLLANIFPFFILMKISKKVSPKKIFKKQKRQESWSTLAGVFARMDRLIGPISFSRH
jgi:hypothetical protein